MRKVTFNPYSKSQSVEAKNAACVLFLQEHSEMKFKKHDKKFEIQSEMDCTVGDVIYLINCGGRDKAFIGQISNLRACIRLNKQQILDPRLRSLYVNHHIA